MFWMASGLELAPIGGQLFAHDNSQRDCTAFRLPIVTYATRLLAQPLTCHSIQSGKALTPCVAAPSRGTREGGRCVAPLCPPSPARSSRGRARDRPHRR